MQTAKVMEVVEFQVIQWMAEEEEQLMTSRTGYETWLEAEAAVVEMEVEVET